MPDWATMQTEVEVKWRGGHAIARADTGLPETNIARQGQRLMTKFDSLVSPVLGIAGTLELAAALDAVEATSVRQLMALCQSQGVQP
jgi:phosphoribosyl-dephospho-CoA transferase